ncbi:MAG: four helix bundle protein [Candidatus Brocadia sp.]|nr:four helix bundle protein [Candidatus Brocadia sp.]
MYRFEKLEVWKKAMDFCELIYQKSKIFPKTEVYGLTSQIRRATTSIPLNIAEGSACRTKKEFTQFLTIALRSQYEVVTIIELCYRLNFLLKADSDLLQDKLAEIGRLLQGLINSLNSKVVTNNQQLETKN